MRRLLLCFLLIFLHIEKASSTVAEHQSEYRNDTLLLRIQITLVNPGSIPLLLASGLPQVLAPSRHLKSLRIYMRAPKPRNIASKLAAGLTDGDLGVLEDRSNLVRRPAQYTAQRANAVTGRDLVVCNNIASCNATCHTILSFLALLV